MIEKIKELFKLMDDDSKSKSKEAEEKIIEICTNKINEISKIENLYHTSLNSFMFLFYNNEKLHSPKLINDEIYLNYGDICNDSKLMIKLSWFDESEIQNIIRNSKDKYLKSLEKEKEVLLKELEIIDNKINVIKYDL